MADNITVLLDQIYEYEELIDDIRKLHEPVVMPHLYQGARCSHCADDDPYSPGPAPYPCETMKIIIDTLGDDDA